MKRGRPSAASDVRRDILGALAGYQYPVTASTVKRLVDRRRVHPCGWDTVRKYLDELVAERLVLSQALPADRGCKPLVVYMGRSRETDSGRQFLGTYSSD